MKIFLRISAFNKWYGFSQDCLHKLAQTRWLKANRFILTVLEARHLSLGMGRLGSFCRFWGLPAFS